MVPPQALIRRQAKFMIGIDGVETLILEIVGFGLIEEPDTPTLLTEIDNRAMFLAAVIFETLFELFAAITAKRKPDIAGVTLRMYPYGASVFIADPATHHRRMLFAVPVVEKSRDREYPQHT